MKLTLALVVIALTCFLAIEARDLRSSKLLELFRRFEQLNQEERMEKRGCIALGGTGCEANNGKCCRDGNPYTGTMRKCVNKGEFDSPIYTCVA